MQLSVEKLEQAQTYIEQLANGINPMTGNKVKTDDVINDVEISRCLFFVSDILKQFMLTQKSVLPVQEPVPDISSEKNPTVVKDIPGNSAITVTELANQINIFIKPKKVAPVSITDWLESEGFLVMQTNHGSSRRYPTDLGKSIGIISQPHVTKKGQECDRILYDKKAQNFIRFNLPSIMDKSGD